MDIILLERVTKLGQIGDVVTVKNGYARNFLLPTGKALRATASNKTFFESQRKEIEALNLKAKSEAENVGAKMEGASAIIIRQAGESGQLFGSVSARDITEALGANDIKVDRSQVVLDRAIKVLGIETIAIKLHPEVFVNVEINIARSEEEAEMQAQGISTNKLEEEEDEISVEDYFENEDDAADASDSDEEESAPAEEASEEEKSAE
jgi:large subunit ribosomal protein L9